MWCIAVGNRFADSFVVGGEYAGDTTRVEMWKGQTWVSSSPSKWQSGLGSTPTPPKA
jgi:hypothetical protein